MTKIETLNPVRSLKGRGADFYMQLQEAAGQRGPIVCASAGNFGQAMAYAGRARDIPVIVYADERANPLKVERMLALGAEVRQTGADFDAAKLASKAVAAAQGLPMAEDSLQPEFSEGAGTIGLELLQVPDKIDTFVIALGNGDADRHRDTLTARSWSPSPRPPWTPPTDLAPIPPKTR